MVPRELVWVRSGAFCITVLLTLNSCAAFRAHVELVRRWYMRCWWVYCVRYQRPGESKLVSLKGVGESKVVALGASVN